MAALAVVIMCGLHAHAGEMFPLHIAVEFTDHAAGAYIARDKGWFEAEGIKPTFYSYLTGMSLAAALCRGEIQAAYLCLLPAINARANAGTRIKVVAGTHKHGYALAINPDRVKSVKDLERPDIRIGAVRAGGPADAILLKTIERYDLDQAGILSRVRRMSPPMQIMAIQTGKLDASFSPEHWPAMAEEAGFKILLRSQDVWPDMQGSVLIVKEELIRDHPDMVRKLTAITGKATTWINQHPEEAASVMAEQLQIQGDKMFSLERSGRRAMLKISQQAVRRSMERLEYTTHIDSKGVQAAIDFAARQGYIKKRFRAADILDLRFSQ